MTNSELPNLLMPLMLGYIILILNILYELVFLKDKQRFHSGIISFNIPLCILANIKIPFQTTVLCFVRLYTIVTLFPIGNINQ